MLAKRVGRSRSSITNTLRLLELGQYAKNFLMDGQLEMGHARALLSLDESNQAIAVDKIIRDNLTVRQTETLVNHLKSPQTHSPHSFRREDTALMTSWQQRLATCRVQGKVKIASNTKITLNVSCTNRDEMEQLVRYIEKGIEADDD